MTEYITRLKSKQQHS